jgi:hypothetical protein
MNNKFDELAKGLAQSVTRRQALRKFGVGLAGMVLACFGVANRAAGANINACDPPYSCCCHKCRTNVSKNSPWYVTCADECALNCA